MRRAASIGQDLAEIHTVEDLTEAFEGIASLRIARIRNRVVTSKAFFAELWQTYRGLRVDPKQHLTHRHRAEAVRDKDVFVAVTAEKKLSGAIDALVIDELARSVGGSRGADIVIIGSQGAGQLSRHGLSPAQSFKLPDSDTAFDVGPIVTLLQQYRHINVLYQTYESLRVQKVARIELIAAIGELTSDVQEGDEEVISSRDYIFEPDLEKIIVYMESVMMEVALIQVIMESKLAQYAGRFNAMNVAKRRAATLVGDYQRQYYRAKRGEGDERLKEIMKVVHHGSHWAS